MPGGAVARNRFAVLPAPEHNGGMKHKLPHRPGGFTLVELLVVIAIISILMGITIPAVQSMRASAKSLECRNNLRNIGLAVTSYYTTNRRLPPSFEVPEGTVVRGSWSVHARIMPYSELTAAYRNIDFDTDWHDQVGTGIPALAVPLFNCPSEPNSQTRIRDGSLYVHGTNYGFNMGSWLIHDPATGQRGDGAFVVNEGRRLKDVTDGLSNTLAAADVKAYTSYIRNVDSIDTSFPSTPDHFLGTAGELKLGLSIDQNTGHTVWCDGRVHHTGFTTVFRPNTRVPYEVAGQTYDIDFTSQQEGRDLTRPTYAAVTSRSHHPGGVNTVNLDGAVRFVSDSISTSVWQALGSINGGEVISEAW